ncbi:MAG: SGNH/GDSL hydrolase family protein, partial [Verrucomicrobiota bacterium]
MKTTLRRIHLGATLALLSVAHGEKMRPAEEPEEVGLVSIGASYFPTPEGAKSFALPNSGFETSIKSGEGWVLSGWDEGTDEVPEGQTYLSGSRGANLRISVSGLPVVGGQPYLLSLWLRSNQAVRGTFSSETEAIRYGKHVPLALPDTNGAWKRVGFYVRAAPGATSARFSWGGNKSPALAIDEIRFRKASEAEFTKAYEGWRSQYPQRDLSARPTDGRHLALFLRKLTQPQEPAQPLLVYGIGSSYTNMLGNGERLIQHVRERFPQAPPIIYKKHVGSAVNYDFTRGWMRQLVAGQQPDLVILYSGGEAEDLDRLLTDFRARSTADIIVASLHLRERDVEISPETIDNAQWDGIREIAAKHGVEFVENRREQAAYLQDLGEPIDYLLKDAVHQSDHGALVINENIVRHLSLNDNPAYDPAERERRILTSDLEITFTGNRIDLIAKTGPTGGTADVFINDIPAAEYPAFCTTLIIPGPQNHRPERGSTSDRAPHAVELGQNIVPQRWTIRMTSDTGDYELMGSTTGKDGRGNSDRDFTSRSGQITVRSDLWR